MFLPVEKNTRLSAGIHGYLSRKDDQPRLKARLRTHQ